MCVGNLFGGPKAPAPPPRMKPAPPLKSPALLSSTVSLPRYFPFYEIFSSRVINLSARLVT